METAIEALGVVGMLAEGLLVGVVATVVAVMGTNTFCPSVYYATKECAWIVGGNGADTEGHDNRFIGSQ